MQRELGRYGEATLPPSSTLPTSVLPGVPYEAHAGLVIFWDFAAGLSRQVSQCTPYPNPNPNPNPHPHPHPHPHPNPSPNPNPNPTRCPRCASCIFT